MTKNLKAEKALPEGKVGVRLCSRQRRQLIRSGERTGCSRTLRRCLAVASVGRALAEVGASLKTPRPVVLCPWPARKRARRLWELKCL